MKGVNWKEMTDTTVAAILFALEGEYDKIHRNTTYTAGFKRAIEALSRGATKEYRRRNLHWAMFMSDD